MPQEMSDMSNGKVIIRLLGGLGNQLFQVSFGLIIAKKLNCTLYLDSSLLLDHSSRRHLVNRRSYVSLFHEFPAEIDTLSRLRNNGFNTNTVVRGISKVLRAVAPIATICESETLNNISSVCSLIYNIYGTGRVLYFDGCWQFMYDYPEYSQIIKNAFQFNTNIYKDFLELSNASSIDFDTSVAVHVRRSDYLIPENLSYIEKTDESYYQRAILKFEPFLDLKSLKLYVFSDDLEWCRNNFSFSSIKTCYVQNPDPSLMASDIYDFMFMSLFKYFVIPNSTYSLWSSYLSKHLDKRIIAPSKWFKHAQGPPPLCLEYLELL